MNEEKNERIREENEQTADIEIASARSMFKLSENNQQNNIKPVAVSRTEEKSEEVRLQPKKQIKKKQKKGSDKLSFLLGLVILIFAVIGVVLMVWNGVRYINESTASGSEYAQYNEFLAPIAAVDPDSFDDITAASTQQLLNASIWSILNLDTTPDTYSYSGGYMLIPAADVESAYIAIFGPETAQSLTHSTVQGYNCTFEYDSTTKVYKIPVTTIMPVYTPRVTKVSKSGTSLVVTVEYLPAESWVQDIEGNMVTPEADKVMKITLRELQGSYYIAALQTVSSTIPDVIITESTTAENVSETVAQETTTVLNAVKTTLAGRV